jgi:hypothetical protein
MGFKEDAIAFKRELTEISTLRSVSTADAHNAQNLLEEAVVLKKMLDPEYPDSPASRYDNIKKHLASLSWKLGIDGFRCGRIAFTSFKRTSPGGKEYTVNAIEELPE